MRTDRRTLLKYGLLSTITPTALLGCQASHKQAGLGADILPGGRAYEPDTQKPGGRTNQRDLER